MRASATSSRATTVSTFDTTITLVGANGQTVSKHVTFTDINWNTGGDDDEDY